MASTTVETLVVLVLGVAPGLLFELGIERGQAYWRTAFSDRLLRFFAWSLLFQAALLPLTYALWSEVISTSQWQSGGGPVWPLYLVAPAYTLMPLVLGIVVGGTSRPGTWLRRYLLGSDLPPRAWDHLFADGQPCLIRARLGDGTWVAGVWGYASSYPAEDDLMLSRRLSCDPTTGELELDADGYAREIGWGVLIRRQDVDRIEFQQYQLHQ